MSCNCDPCEKAKRANLGHNWPNKRCKPVNKWFSVNVTEASYLMSLEEYPAALWYVQGNEAPDAGRLDATTLDKGRSGVAFLWCPGRWWIYFESTGNGKECFKLIPTGDPVTARTVGVLQGLVGPARQAPSFRVKVVPVDVMAQSTRCPDIAVMPGFDVSVIAHPDNLGRITVASNITCPNFDDCVPLDGGMGLDLPLLNTSAIYFQATDAADKLILIIPTDQPQPVCGS